VATEKRSIQQCMSRPIRTCGDGAALPAVVTGRNYMTLVMSRVARICFQFSTVSAMLCRTTIVLCLFVVFYYTLFYCLLFIFSDF